VIILDTNVLSALMRRKPDQQVVTWLDQQPRLSVWTTAVTLFEIRFGLAVMPIGRRQTELQEAFARLTAEILENRILAFDTPAARETAILAAARQRAGRTGDLRDSMIAGIVVAARARLATRNTQHFDDIGASIVDPWSTTEAP